MMIIHRSCSGWIVLDSGFFRGSSRGSRGNNDEENGKYGESLGNKYRVPFVPTLAPVTFLPPIDYRLGTTNWWHRVSNPWVVVVDPPLNLLPLSHRPAQAVEKGDLRSKDPIALLRVA